MAELKAVSLSYRPPGGRLLFDNLDLTLAPGETIGVTGSNGEGKTTLMRILAGLLLPDRGTVLLDGEPVWRKPRAETARALGYLPQSEVAPFPVTAWQMVLFGRFPHMIGRRLRENAEDRAEAETAMRTTGVYHLRTTPFPQLSGGEKMRVRIARLLAQNPTLLLMDEPTTYLDDDFKQSLAALLRRLAPRGCGAIVVSHDAGFLLDTCNRVYCLEAAALHARKPLLKENQT